MNAWIQTNFSEFVSGYENVIVKEDSKSIVGLEEGKTYEYRVKRFKNKRSSEFSQTITVNVITDIEESSLAAKVYPNPVYDNLKIELPVNVTSANVVIHSMSGEVVGRYISIQNESSINLQNLPHGIFILTVSADGKSKRYKLVRSE